MAIVNAAWPVHLGALGFEASVFHQLRQPTVESAWGAVPGLLPGPFPQAARRTGRATASPNRYDGQTMQVSHLHPKQQRLVAHDVLDQRITRTPSNRVGSSISTRRPSASTASFAVCQETPKLAATRATERWSITSASNAHRVHHATTSPAPVRPV